MNLLKHLKFDFCLLFVFCSLLFVVFQIPSLASNIEQIESTRSLGVDYVNIGTNTDTKPTAILLDDQIVIDFPNTQTKSNLSGYRARSTRIKAISSQQIGTTARITIDLKKASDYELINVFGRNKIVLEIYDHVNYTAKLMQAWEKKMLEHKAAALDPYKLRTLSEGALTNKIIVIDPGHGGIDPGAISSQGTFEKNLTLATAKKLASLLNKLGATVYLTRNKDRTNNLKDIAEFSNKINADIFISLHYNYIYNREISGTETFYYNSNSRKLGLTIHRSLIADLKTKDRGLRKEMFYTIHHTQMPAILIEPLFLSNGEDLEKANSPEFQEKISYAISEGVINYFRN